MKILVTGGAGFLGSHIAERYRAEGHEVVIVDDMSTGQKRNLPHGVRLYKISLNDPELATVLRKESPEIVNHHAAQIDVRKSVADPANDAQINVIGTLNLLEACRVIHVRKIIFASSGGAIYGEQKYFPADEKHPIEPRSPYGIAKLTVEKYLQYYFWTYGISFVALRYANVYGPRQNAEGEAGVVAIFTKRVLKKEGPMIYGDGSQTRDYVYIEDVVACNVEALQQGVQGVFNVGTGVETNVRHVADVIIRLIGDNLLPQYAPGKLGEQRRSCLKPGALQKVPPTYLTLGLKKTIEWFKNINTNQSRRIV